MTIIDRDWPVDPLVIDAIQRAADCCRPTAIKALRGEKIRGRVGYRVRAALESLGIAPAGER